MLLDILISRVVLTKKPRRFSIISFQAILYQICLSQRVSIQRYAIPFFKGTFLLALHHRNAGAAINDIYRVVLFGQIYDSPYLQICDNEGIQGSEWLITEEQSNLSGITLVNNVGHSLQRGEILLGGITAEYGASLHPSSLVMSQHLENGVTLSARTKVSLTSRISRNASGIYAGSPARECDCSDNNTRVD